MKLKVFFAVSIPELEVSGFFSLLLLLSSKFGFDFCKSGDRVS